jgi:hypothetical protein
MEVVGRGIARKSTADDANSESRSCKDRNTVPTPVNDRERLHQSIKQRQKARFDRPQDDPKQLDDGELPSSDLTALELKLFRIVGDATGLEVGHIPQRIHLLGLQYSHGEGT